MSVFRIWWPSPSTRTVPVSEGKTLDEAESDLSRLFYLSKLCVRKISNFPVEPTVIHDSHLSTHRYRILGHALLA